MDHFNEMFVLLSTSPGASCKSMGVRAGATIRKLLNVSFDTPPAINWYFQRDL